MNKNIINQAYHQLLNDLKTSVASAKYKASLHVNKALVSLYHHIGSRILHTQMQERWGTGVIAEFSKDLRAVFLEMKGSAHKTSNICGSLLKHMIKMKLVNSLLTKYCGVILCTPDLFRAR